MLERLRARGETATRRPHLITTAIEHPAVLRTCRYLEERLACLLTVVPVDRAGLVDPDDVRRAIEPHTVLITVHANNEAGIVQPIEETAALARADPRRRTRPGCAPAPRAPPTSWRSARPANLPASVSARERSTSYDGLWDRLHAALQSACPGLLLNGHPDRRHSNTLNAGFPGIDGVELLACTHRSRRSQRRGGGDPRLTQRLGTGMSNRTQTPEAAVRPATTAIAPA